MRYPTKTRRILLVGVDDKGTVDSKTTQTQITEILALECTLYDKKPLTWGELDHLLQGIAHDRRLRTDQHTYMADRPAFAAVSVAGSKVVRLEFYGGHDEFKLIFDLRSTELQGKKLPNFLNPEYPCQNRGLSFPATHCAPPAGYREGGHECQDCPLKKDT